MRHFKLLGLALLLQAGLAAADPAGASITITSGDGIQLIEAPGVGPSVVFTGFAFSTETTIMPILNFTATSPARPSEVAFSPVERLQPVAPGLALEGPGVKLPDETFSIPEAPAAANAGKASRKSGTGHKP